MKNETLARAAASKKLHRHLIYMAPKLQASIEKYLNLYESGLDSDEEMFTENDTIELEVSCMH